ncbi:hypothetical protein [Rahnella perminowiae]|uniref:hypothetical protein n=1 Tax=Rahnella perminowiae TaxID=2816244 RepID=UPI00215B7DC8|nr:hypothetical protein [Rahnella perminowiae]
MTDSLLAFRSGGMKLTKIPQAQGGLYRQWLERIADTGDDKPAMKARCVCFSPARLLSPHALHGRSQHKPVKRKILHQLS